MVTDAKAIGKTETKFRQSDLAKLSQGDRHLGLGQTEDDLQTDERGRWGRRLRVRPNVIIILIATETSGMKTA